MKRQNFFKSMLCLLLGLVCHVAWAQPQASDAPVDGQWAENTTWYQIQTKNGNDLVGDIFKDDYLKLANQTAGTKDAALWCLVGDTDNGYTFYNKAVGTATPLGMTSYASDGAARAKFVAAGTENYVTAFDLIASQKEGGWCIRVHDGNNNNYYWNSRSDYLSTWNNSSATDDDGSAFVFTECIVLPYFSTEEAPEYWWIQFCTGSATLADQGADTNVQTATKTYTDAQLWMLVGDESGFYMKNKAGRYLSWTGTDKGNGRFQTTTTADSKATLILHNSGNAHATEAGCYEIQLNGGSYMNQNGGAGTGKQLGTWNAGDPNNHFVFVSAEPTYPKFDNEEAWYYIQFGNGGWSIEDKGADLEVKTAKTDDLTTQKWRVTGTKDNCQFINQEGRYLVYDADKGRVVAKATTDLEGFKIVPTTNSNYAPRLEIQHNSTSDKAFNMNTGAGKDKSIALYNSNDGGNPLAFVPVESVVFPEFRIAASSAAAPAEKLTLWYTQPATATDVANTWMEYSLPLGNGQFGASLFGGVAKDEILFNDKTLWSGGPSEYGYYLPFGSVYIEDISGDFTFNPTKPVQNYYRDLNLKTATGTVSYENAEGVKFTRQYIASNPDKAIVTKITASEAGKLNLRITMASGKPTVKAETTYENGYAQFSGKLQTVSYNATLKVVAEGGYLSTGAEGITVEEADEVLIVLMGSTDFVGNLASHVNGRAAYLGDDNKAIVDAVAQKGWDAVYADHVADHQKYFNRVDFELDGVANDRPTNELITEYNAATGTRNLMLEQLYYHYGRYLSIASSRGVDLPNNLQGIWNNTCTPPWHSDIHANINVQMNYWPVSAGNLAEMYVPFLNQIINEAAQPEWRALASNAVTSLNTTLGTTTAVREDSWTLLTENNIFGGISGFAPNYVIANAWYVTHMWQHYRYTLDKEYLAKAFPAMKGSSLFWADRMVYNEEDGTYECPNEYSPEHGPGSENAVAHAQQIAWESIDNTIKAADILGGVAAGIISQEDYDLLVERRDQMDRGLAIEVYEEHSETGWPAERNGIKAGDPILREWKYSRFYVSNDKGHRHMSHLMALYPFGQLTPADKDLFEAAINSMKLRGDASTGWSMGWKINLWARALMPERSHAVLRTALRHSTSYGTDQGQGGIYYNLFDSHAPFQIDGNFGATSGIQEMLMQSHTEVIDILPALPAEWTKGSIKGLKAVGDFTVDIEWESNQARKVVITNNQGQPCYVKCVGLSAATVTVDGVAVELGEETTHGGLPCYEIASEAGDEIVIDLSNAIQNDKSALEALIAKTQALVDECYDYYATEAPLTTTEGNAYYVSTNADQNTGDGNKDGAGIAGLVDNTADTYFHSRWGGTAVNEPHYIQVDLGEGKSLTSLKFKYVAHSAPDPKKIVVSGSNDVDGEFTDIQTITKDVTDVSAEYESPIIQSPNAYRYLRFTVTESARSGYGAKFGDYYLFAMKEFDLMPRSEEPVVVYDGVLVPDAAAAATTAIATAEEAVEATQTVAEYTASLAALQAKYDELVAAIASGTLPVLVSLDTDKPFVYKIGIKREDKLTNPVLEYDYANTQMVAVKTFDATNMNHGWYFTKGSAEGQVFIHPYLGGGDVLASNSISDGAGKVKAMPMNSEGYTQEWTVPVQDATNNIYNIKPTSGNTYFSNHGGTGNKMGFYNNTTDSGSKFTFTRITIDGDIWEHTLEAFVNTFCTKESYTEGNTLGYHQNVAAYNEARATAIAALANEEATNEEYKNAYTALRSAKEALVFLTPETGKFYRVKSVVGNRYITAPANTGTAMSMSTEVSAMNIFYMDATNHLLVYGSGFYINGKNHAHMGYKDTYRFEESKNGTAGAFAIKPGTQYYWYDNNPNLDVYANGTHANCDWIVEEVTSLPVTISSVGYATLYAPVALNIPEGVTAYTGTVNGEWLTLTEIEGGVIPANEGVILYADNADTYNFDIAADAVENVEGNVVTGKIESHATNSVTTGTPYTLQSNGEGGVVFRKYTGDNLNGFKSYLVLSTDATQAIRIRFGNEENGEGGTTAIDNEQLTIDNGQLTIYDLQGRRVLNPTKGMYIVNGKKIVIK